MYRGHAYPIELISTPDDEEDGAPVPILEWSSPLDNANKRKISMRLQGTPSKNVSVGEEEEVTNPNPVTLVYDATFQNDPRLEPAM